jgi:DNA-binding response OmpR family regulator
VRRVLIIEDDEAIRGMLAGLLTDEGGCDVTSADFEAAPEPRTFALLIADLPARPYVASDARDWVRSLRDRYPRTPILVCTAHREASEAPDRLGADCIVLKPFDVPQLLAMTDHLTGETFAPSSGAA